MIFISKYVKHLISIKYGSYISKLKTIIKLLNKIIVNINVVNVYQFYPLLLT